MEFVFEQVQDDQESELQVGLDRVQFLNVDSFEMVEPITPENNGRVSAFSTIFPNFGLPKGVQRLHIKKATANRITSGLSSPLLVKSENTIRLKGNEGISIRGREVIIGADQDLLLRSLNGSIILDGSEGILLDVDSMPVIGNTSFFCVILTDYSNVIQTSTFFVSAPSAPMIRGSRPGAPPAAMIKTDRIAEYKLCICMPAGQLFRIPVLEGAESIQCDSVDLSGDDNPCV